MPTKAQIESAPERPAVLDVLAENIPAQLAGLDRHVVWRHVWKAGKKGGGEWSRVPFCARTRRAASSTDPATWSTFEQALAAYRAGGYSGIGFVLGDGIVGVDLDDAIDQETGLALPWAQEIVGRLDTYAERSPTGTGLKLFALGRKPGSKCKAKYGTGEVEVYDSVRCSTVTGHRLEGTPAVLNERTPQLAEVYQLVFGTKGQEKGQAKAKANITGNLSDDALLDRARAATNGADFRRLYDDGSTAEYGNNHSSADQALANMLVWWTNHDLGRADRLFRASRLMRDKWDERHYADGRTYGEGALASADAFVSGGYTGNGQASTNGKHEGGSGEPKQPDREAPDEGTAYQIILKWFREQLVPQFRRGNVLYCEGLPGTVKTVRMADVCDAPHPDLVELLIKATDAPTLHRSSEVDQLALIGNFFVRWAKVAFEKLLSEYAEEDQAAEVSPAAEEEFSSRVAAALLSHVTLGQNVRRGGLDVTEMQRRPLIDYAVAFANKNAGKWGDVRGYQLWSRLGPDKAVQVAIRKELFGQLQGFADLARLSSTKFTRLCGMYSVGEGDRVKGGRSVVLSPAFLARLREKPDDTLTDRDSRARTCEGESVKASESTHEHEDTRVNDDTSDDTSRRCAQSVSESVNGKCP
jgi:hypothetical protein